VVLLLCDNWFGGGTNNAETKCNKTKLYTARYPIIFASPEKPPNATNVTRSTGVGGHSHGCYSRLSHPEIPQEVAHGEYRGSRIS